MSAYPILTALSLPAVTTFPSVDCFQWSDDGHAALLTRNAVYILVYHFPNAVAVVLN